MSEIAVYQKNLADTNNFFCWVNTKRLFSVAKEPFYRAKEPLFISQRAAFLFTCVSLSARRSFGEMSRHAEFHA